MSARTSREIEVVFIGTSAGGISALQRLFRVLPTNLRQPFVVVQHLPPDARIEPQMIFGHGSPLVMAEAVDKGPLEAGHVYFAPPGYHLLVEKDFTFSFTQEEPVHFARPSIDVLFESAAVAYGARACGILLTGANSDGAAGLKVMLEHGALTMVQDPRDAEVASMPRAALALFRPDLVGSIEMIGDALSRLSWAEL